MTRDDCLSAGGFGRILLVATGLVACAAASLFTHDLALSHLGVPYPHRGPLPLWARAADLLLRLIGMVWLARAAHARLELLGTGRAMLLLITLLAMSSELTRVIVVNDTLAASPPGHPYLVFAIARFAPTILASSLLLALVVPLERVARGRPAMQLAGIVGLSILGTIALLPATATFSSFFQARLSAFDADNLYIPPYPAWVMGVIYATYLEPTLAAYGLLLLAWPPSQGGIGRHVLAFALMLCLLRGRIGMMLVDSWFVALPSLPARFAATGQFLAETAVLGLLTGLIHHLAFPRRPPPMEESR